MLRSFTTAYNHEKPEKVLAELLQICLILRKFCKMLFEINLASVQTTSNVFLFTLYLLNE